MAEFGIETSLILLLTELLVPLYYMDHLRLWQEGGGLDLYFTRKGVEYEHGVDMLN